MLRLRGGGHQLGRLVTLLGERVGPVRAIRETWGADSGTNVIRRETFYRDEMRQKNWLRVHVIPPLDGIYAQWDFNAGVVTTFYNSRNPTACRSTAATTRRSATSTTRATRTTTTTTRAPPTRSTATRTAQAASGRPARTTSRSTRATDVRGQRGATGGLDHRAVRHDRRPHHSHADRPDAGRRGAVAGGGAVLPRRLVLRRRHRHRPGPEPRALGRRAGSAADGRRASAGRRRRRCPPAATTSTRARSPRTACTCSSIADSDNARQTVPVTEIVWNGGWSCCRARRRRDRRPSSTGAGSSARTAASSSTPPNPAGG